MNCCSKRKEKKQVCILCNKYCVENSVKTDCCHNFHIVCLILWNHYNVSKCPKCFVFFS